ncbi:hypothetical protein [Sulfuricurvum sp.]|uniref:hypothetical protein n=1 Tax=Sulfuricurvum sp. TaxID=2025608 RepID=UPI00356314BE
MAPINDREFGGLERQVDIDHENVVELFKKMDALTGELHGYYDRHNNVHVAIGRQLGGLAVLTAILLLVAGAAITKLFGS